MRLAIEPKGMICMKINTTLVVLALLLGLSAPAEAWFLFPWRCCRQADDYEMLERNLEDKASAIMKKYDCETLDACIEFFEVKRFKPIYDDPDCEYAADLAHLMDEYFDLYCYRTELVADELTGVGNTAQRARKFNQSHPRYVDILLARVDAEFLTAKEKKEQEELRKKLCYEAQQTFDKNDPVYKVLAKYPEIGDVWKTPIKNPTNEVERVAFFVWKHAPYKKKGTMEGCMRFLQTMEIPHYSRLLNSKYELLGRRRHEILLAEAIAAHDAVLAYMVKRADEIRAEMARKG
jgi:hypothetical protein